MQMYSETDVDSSCLQGKRIAILGYGSQGRAHALNLKDSGHDVVMGLRPGGGSWSKAEADGLTVMEPVEAAKGAAIVAFLTPDLTQAGLYTHLSRTAWTREQQSCSPTASTSITNRSSRVLIWMSS